METRTTREQAAYDEGYAKGRADALAGMPVALPGTKIYKATSIGMVARRITRVERSEGGDWQYWTGEYYMYSQSTYGKKWSTDPDRAFARTKQFTATRDGGYKATHKGRSSPVYTWADLEAESKKSNGKEVK